LRQAGALEAAIEVYKKDFYSNSKDWKNTYNLACAYALVYQKDSAYQYLNIALKEDTSLWALADTDLYALIDDPRWADIEKNQIQQFQEKNQKLQQPLYTKKLLQIIMKDQALDYYIDQAKSYFMKKGHFPPWLYPLNAMKDKIVEENYRTITQLIETNGWPKYSTVGPLAADAPLLVINHHKDPAVRKKYVMQIKKSCIENEGSCMEYAKIQDRILVNEHRDQIYGMQFRYTNERTLEPFPIKDPEYVDQRRKEIGLEPLRGYLKRKINYDFIISQKNKRASN
jgi:hypothetical protein